MLVNDLLENTANLSPQKKAIVCDNRRYTYFDIDKASGSLASALVEQGFRKQERAIIYLENSYESVVSIFGILKAAGIFVIIHPSVKPRKLESIILDCSPRVLITDANHVRELSAAQSSLGSLDFILVIDLEKLDTIGKLSNGTKILSFMKMIGSAEPLYLKTGCIDVDLAALIYTSGSSGNPKGVMLTHHNMVSSINSITQYLENKQDDVIINTLPLSFDYGLYQVLMAFKFGGCVILEKGFVFPEQIINIIVKEKVTGWPIVPTIAAILCRLKNLEQHDFSNLRYLTSTGQVLPDNHITRLREVFPGARLYSMYGLTECKRVSFLPPQDIDRKAGSVGIPMPNTEVYLVNDKGIEITDPGVEGELVVRGSNVMLGYWNRPELTDKVLRPGRFPGERVLYTGDLFKKDKEGYLYFISRKDDIIKTSGHMVSPKEVENILYEIPDVVEAAVVGVQDEILGQAVKAYIHLSANSTISEKDILYFCYKNMESYAVPQYISLCDVLPKTESGKIQKRSLQ
jgi:long-chain acyl-CoA synthetase